MEKINTDRKFISVVMPVYNEEKYIRDCIDSLLMQDYAQENMEWLIIDGCSTDKTKDILKEYQIKHPDLIYIFDNPNKTAPFAMNIGISHARGEYIIRLDAHAKYNNDYISKCVYYLNNTDADNVGGLAETRGKGFVGETIALMLSSKFGVGNSQFRTNGSSGYVDTVPFGAFRKEVFENLGGYDERLTRNQDNEMNYRIRKNGGKIFLANDIRFTYYCRDSVQGIAKMAVQNGCWNVITMKLCPGSMGVRHFIPLLFLVSLIFLPIIAIVLSWIWWLYLCEIILYFMLDVFFAIKCTKKIKKIVLLIALFPIFHLAYGFGSLKGIIKLIITKA